MLLPPVAPVEDTSVSAHARIHRIDAPIPERTEHLLAVLAVVALGALATILAAQRGRGFLPHRPKVWGVPQGGRMAWLLATLATVAASAPILAGIPVLFTREPLHLGDSATHAIVAQQVATTGIPHGWVDVYNGGFPFAIHYQSVGYLLVAALARAGLPAVVAIQVVGFAAMIALPLAVLHAARRAGAHPTVGVLGAWLVTWVSPANAFVGAWESFLVAGLLAQALALPLAVLASTEIFTAGRGRSASTWRSPVLAALLIATHPQIATALFAILLPPVVIERGACARRYARAVAAALVMGAAIYGRGVLSLQVPFGFPGFMPAWKQTGFPVTRLGRWILGAELFDLGRAPVFTAAWLGSWVFLVAMVRRAVPRAVLLTGLTALVMSVSGPYLHHAGPAGRFLLSFVMPLRATTLLMLLATAAVVVVVEELRRWAATDLRPAALSLLVAIVPLAGSMAFAAPARSKWVGEFLRMLDRARPGAGAECATDTPRGYATRQVVTWVSGLSRGRLAFDGTPGPAGAGGVMTFCPSAHGVEAFAPVPLGASSGAATHVGTNVSAFVRMHLFARDAWERAETLGVRTVLFADLPGHTLGPGWRETQRSGDVALAERVGGSDLIGAGCVTTVWRGSDAALRAALHEDLLGEARLLSQPRQLVALVRGPGPLVREPAPTAGCEPATVEIDEVRREPGALEANVRVPSRTHVDLVFRATAFPTWTVRIDGTPVPWTMVAPGFFAARVGAGEHHVEAVAGWPTGYRAGLCAALLVVGGLAMRRRPGSGSRIFRRAA